MSKRSLSFSLTAWYTALLAVFFLVFGLAVYFGLRSYLVQTVRQSLTADAKAIGAELVQNADTKTESYVVGEIKKRYSQEAEDRFVRVVRSNGTILYQSSPQQYGGFDASRVPLLTRKGTTPYSREVYLADHHRLLLEGLFVTTPKGTSYVIETGSLYLYVEAVLEGVFIAMSLIMPLFMGSAVIGGRLLTKRALRPVDQITQHAERITSSSLSERLPVIKTGDELERLSVSLNKMISRLQGAFLHVNRFSADVSHELRTPLTILRGDLEAIARQHRLTPQVLDNISSALDETDQLSRIVDHLLTLARLHSDAAVSKTPILLNEMVETTTEQMKLLAEEKDVSIVLETRERVEIQGDSVRVKQVIANLLDNAIKYSKVGGTIRIRVGMRQDQATFEIADHGIGIAAEAVPHVFERFYRADKSRSRSSGGAGLGLAIVKAICTAHGGDVAIASVEEVGTRVTVTFPMAKSFASDPARVLAQTSS
ncbi:MAG: sensor histidine kinase [Bryobacteraceae bacterium]